MLIKQTKGDDVNQQIIRSKEMLLEASVADTVGIDEEAFLAILKTFLDNRTSVRSYDLSLKADLGVDLGLDSLDKVDLLLFIEKEMNISIDPDTSSGAETVENLMHLVNEALGSASGVEARIIGMSDLERHLMHEVPHFLNEVERQQGRALTIDGKIVYDFASANYLGLDLDRRIFRQIQVDLERWGTHPSWTRAIASPMPYNQLERTLSEMVGVPGVLVFPTVTLIHMGVLPLLAAKGTLFLMDERAHKSIQEGASLGRAKGASTQFFKHNDLDDLKAALEAAKGFDAIYICVDGVFSMTGDEARIVDMIALCRSYPNATLYVDDAHGFGILGGSPDGENPYGSGGGGLLRKYGVDVTTDKVIYVAALSKSFSSLAAFVTCRDGNERDFFSTASTFVNSGPCPTASLSSAQTGLGISLSSEGDAIRRRIHALTKRFVDGVRDVGLVVENEGYFPLVSVEIGTIAAVTDASKILWDKGVLITPAVYPNAPIKRSMLRFTITAANTTEEIDAAIEALEIVRDQIPSAPYC